MTITKTYEPIRPLRAPDDGSAYPYRAVLGGGFRVDYGKWDWPSRSYMTVPGTEYEEKGEHPR